jgi:hypothetical protein
MHTRALPCLLAIALLVAACGDAASPAPPAASGSTAASTAGPAASDGAPGVPDPSAEPYVPSSKDLIRRAQADGRLDARTAMLYRVFALFGAPELPAEYRSDVWAEDNAVLAHAQSELEHLPSDVAEAIRPFLARPTDPSSAFHGRPASASLQLASTRSSVRTAAVTCGANGWASIDGVSHFKVWGRCGTGFDNGDLELVAGILDVLWTEESTYMGRQPVPDAGGPDEGGDDRVDVYLIANCVTRAGGCQSHGGLAGVMGAPPFSGASGALASSGFMMINRATIGDPETPATIAHEVFHLIQNAFNWEVTWASTDEYWFTEASATWAEYRFVGDPTSTAYRYMEYQASDLALQDHVDNNIYRSFVWPLFMEEEVGPGTVAATWAAVQGVATTDGFTDVIDAQLPFKDHFRDFAVRDWNDEELAGVIGPMLPIGAVGTPRLIPRLGRRGTSATLPANPAGTAPRPFAVAIDSLAPWFQYLAVNDDVGQVTLDFGGVQPRPAFDVDLLVNVPGIGWDRRQVVGDRIQLCRNVPADKVTEIVVVVSNHDKDPAAHVFGTWTAESLEEPCPVTWTGDMTTTSVLMQHNPRWDEGGARIQNAPDTVITVTITVHLVIVNDGGRVLAGRGSTIVYDRTVTGFGAEPPIHCQGSVGLWQGQAPSALADPAALGQARIQGDPAALEDTELMIEFGIAPPSAEECWTNSGLFPFTRVDEHTWTHAIHESELDPERLYRSVSRDSTGTLQGP